jgi:hypothetical protein
MASRASAALKALRKLAQGCSHNLSRRNRMNADVGGPNEERAGVRSRQDRSVVKVVDNQHLRTLGCSNQKPLRANVYPMSEETELLREMRDLLLVMAEPALAKRDEKRRAALRDIVGKSQQKAKAVLLMDGARTQSAIGKETKFDAGNLSRLVKMLREAELITEDAKENLKLVIPISGNFFDGTEAKHP